VKSPLHCFMTAISLFVVTNPIRADIVIGNLNDAWNQPGIGDIEAITPNQKFGAAFITGNTASTLDSITLEHIQYPGALQSFQVRLYRFGPPGSVPIPAWPLIPCGQLGNATVDPQPTQWPGQTTYVTYTPLAPILLDPNSSYMLGAVEPANGLNETGLLFAPNENYTVADGWSMNPNWQQWADFSTSDSGWQPYFGTLYGLKFQLAATPVPEPGTVSFVVLGLAGAYLCRRNTRIQ